MLRSTLQYKWFKISEKIVFTELTVGTILNSFKAWGFECECNFPPPIKYWPLHLVPTPVLRSLEKHDLLYFLWYCEIKFCGRVCGLSSTYYINPQYFHSSSFLFLQVNVYIGLIYTTNVYWCTTAQFQRH